MHWLSMQAIKKEISIFCVDTGLSKYIHKSSQLKGRENEVFICRESFIEVKKKQVHGTGEGKSEENIYQK